MTTEYSWNNGHLEGHAPLKHYSDLQRYEEGTRIGLKEKGIKSIANNSENDRGVLVDLYIPRHCSATNRLITAQDHASIQIRVADVDSEGKAIKGQATTIAICGKIRAQGDSDDSINRIATKEGLLKNVWQYSR